jgi:hypothetical protein
MRRPLSSMSSGSPRALAAAPSCLSEGGDIRTSKPRIGCGGLGVAGLHSSVAARVRGRLRKLRSLLESEANSMRSRIAYPSAVWLFQWRRSLRWSTIGEGMGALLGWRIAGLYAVMRGPDWKSTAIFLTWDDWGRVRGRSRPA